VRSASRSRRVAGYLRSLGVMATHADDAQLWDEYQRVIARHILPGHDVVDTVNRLLRKSPWFPQPSAVLQIQRTGLSIVQDTWSLPKLWQLIHPRQVTADEPVSTDGAVLALRCNGSEYLMDGRRRINHWYRHNVQGPHRVLILCA
jgi:hypothetical protein